MIVIFKCQGCDGAFAILENEMLNSPDTLQVLLTRFVEVLQVTDHTGLWDAESALYSPRAIQWTCQGGESDEPHWSATWRSLLIHSKCYSPDLILWFGAQPSESMVLDLPDMIDRRGSCKRSEIPWTIRLTSLEVDWVTRVQILNSAICISQKFESNYSLSLSLSLSLSPPMSNN